MKTHIAPEPAPEGADPKTIRIQRIKELAREYENLSVENKVKLRSFIEQDLKDEVSALEKQLANLRGLGIQTETFTRRTASAPSATSAPKSKGKAVGRQKGTMTTGEAILKALEGGKLSLGDLVVKVSELKGGTVKKTSVGQELVRLKKAKKVKDVERGIYALA